MKNFINNFQNYVAMVFFKHSPEKTPQSIGMLIFAFFLSTLIPLFGIYQLIFNSSIFLKMTLFMKLGCLLFYVSFTILFLVYMRVILWAQKLLYQWKKLCICWFMTTFIFTLMQSVLNGLVLAVQIEYPLFSINPILSFILKGIKAFLFFIWPFLVKFHILKVLTQKSTWNVFLVYMMWVILSASILVYSLFYIFKSGMIDSDAVFEKVEFMRTYSS